MPKLLRSTGRASVACGSILLLGGCATRAEVETATTSRDSAGIVIVDNRAPRWHPNSAWTIGEQPTIDIVGGGTPDTDLSQIAGAVRLSDGRIAVATTLSNAIRFFDPSGKSTGSMGRKGSGPGEFQAISGLWRGPHDSLIAADLMLQRLTVVDSAGSFQRNFALGGQTSVTTPGANGQFGIALPVGAFPDGSMLGMRMAFALNQKREGTYRDTVTLIRYRPDGTTGDTLGRFPGIEMNQVPITFGGQTVATPSPAPLGRQTVSAPTVAGIMIAQNNAWEVEVRDTAGTLRRLIRMAAETTPITAADANIHREEQVVLMEGLPQLRAVPKQFKDQFLDRVRTAVYPATLPWIAAIFPVADGSLWIEEIVKPGVERRRFAVFDSTGVFLGRVDAPPKLRVTAIYSDAVVGVWRDPDDIEHVRVHTIER